MILGISLIKVQHKTMLKFKMSHSNLSKSQEIELRNSISDKTSGHRGSVATPICFPESNTPLFGGLGRDCWAVSTHHSSFCPYLILGLMSFGKELSLFHFLSQLGVLQVWFPARAQVRDASGQFLQLSIHLAISPTGPARKKETIVINHYHCHDQSSTLMTAEH